MKQHFPMSLSRSIWMNRSFHIAEIWKLNGFKKWLDLKCQINFWMLLVKLMIGLWFLLQFISQLYSAEKANVPIGPKMFWMVVPVFRMTYIFRSKANWPCQTACIFIHFKVHFMRRKMINRMNFWVCLNRKSLWPANEMPIWNIAKGLSNIIPTIL